AVDVARSGDDRAPAVRREVVTGDEQGRERAAAVGAARGRRTEVDTFTLREAFDRAERRNRIPVTVAVDVARGREHGLARLDEQGVAPVDARRRPRDDRLARREVRQAVA